jgi:hypothetical protein
MEEAGELAKEIGFSNSYRKNKLDDFLREKHN